MKNRILTLLVFVQVVYSGYSQVAEMNWELDYEIYLKMSNDSNYTYDIRELFHITDVQNTDFSTEFVFYPVSPGAEYSQRINEGKTDTTSFKTLWSALHANLGGGWIHFTNCIAYALETQLLNLQEPILKRPQTKWKPDPVTETWKRTKKWKYYIPVNQKTAIKEYKLRQEENALGDIKNLPASYIELFLNTSDKEYLKLKGNREYNEVAKIDLVKIILGANYLGEPQINYISNAVKNAVKTYSASKLPSVLIFDEFDAAAAMTLDVDGYNIESIVFRATANLDDDVMNQRKEEIEKIVENINTYNKQAFQKRLKSYYSD
ncbi:MAG: hypothetical protein JW894_05005 [Bacteroidales bacterium]|nr:hypothetical protein [Bacteroidales bacterium]